MISTLTGSGAGPVNGYIFAAPTSPPSPNDSTRIIVFSTKKNALSPTLLSNQPNAGSAYYYNYSDIVSSSNANVVVVTASGGPSGYTPFMAYSRSGNTFTSLNAPTISGTYNGNSYITDSGDYIITNGSFSGLPSGENTSILVYHNNNGSFTRLARPGSGVSSAAISGNGTFLAAYNFQSYAIAFYKKAGTGNAATYSTLHQSFTIGNGNSAYAGAFSPDGTYYCTPINGTLRVKIYKYNSSTDTWSDLNQPPSGGTLPAQGVNLAVWSYDGNELYLTYKGSQTWIYERSGDQFTYRGLLNFPVTSIHPSGKYLASGSSVYRRVSLTNWQQMLALPSAFIPGPAVFTKAVTS